MAKLLEKIKSSPTTFSSAVITQTTMGLWLVIILLVNLSWKNTIIETWTPYILIYLAYLIVVSPILSRFTPSTPSWKKYITAREELVKAQKCVKNNPEDVMYHIRSAIDLSIKQKFGFNRIQPMSKFLQDAKEFDLPLPSYELIYQYFSAGSDRSHLGKLNTPFEVSQITKTVSEFFDELDKVTISQIKIEEFKKKCKYVE